MATNVYEGMYILDSNRYGRDSDAVSGKIREMIEKAGGEILVSRLWEERRLAYPIKGHRKGTYWLSYFRLDSSRLVEIRRACDEFGMPLVVWSYPRGSAIETKGGRDSLYAVDYAARVAHELGADVIKLNAPKGTSPDSPKPYNELDMTPEEMLCKVIISAGNSMVLLSGGSKISDDDLLTKVGMAMEAGATGLIFGRNMWQRRKEDALAITKRVKEVLARYSA